jgi:ribosomal protein S27AE
MWQCDNCGYTDEDGTTFEEETEEGMEEPVRYCPECGSDEVFLVDDEDEDELDEEEEPARVEDVAEWEEAEDDANASEEW